MSKRNSIILFIVAAVLVGLLIYGFGPQLGIRTQKQLTLGAILPLTGSGAQYGEDARRGIELALEKLHNTDGQPFEVVFEDSRTDPKTAVSAFQKVLSINKISAVITEVSGVVLALAPVANREQIVVFNMGAQSPDIENAGPFVFSDINLANVESAQLADFAYNKLGIRKAGILYANVAYGEGARKVFSEAFKAANGQIVAEVAFPEDGTDYRAQIVQMMRSHPEAVYLPGHTKDMAMILKQSLELGFHPQWLSYTAFEGQEILEIAGSAANGVIYSSLSLDIEGGSSTLRDFLTAYRQKYSIVPGIYSATAYDATLILAKAVRSGAHSGSEIRDFLRTMEPFEGASGVAKFGSQGTVNKPLIFKTVKNGEFVRFAPGA